MIGHLGSRVSALLDGRLGPEETERAWAHVHTCHGCRDLVEREGWVKSRLARLSGEQQAAPARLKGSILDAPAAPDLRGLAPVRALTSPAGRTRRARGLASMSGGVVGAAVVGVLAVGAAAPANAPGADRRGPVSQPASPLPASISGFTPASRTTTPRP